MKIGYSELGVFAKKLAPHTDGGKGKLSSIIVDTQDLVAAEMGTSSSLKTVSLEHPSVVSHMFEEPRTRGEGSTLGAMPVFRPQNEQSYMPPLPPMQVDHCKLRHMSQPLVNHKPSNYRQILAGDAPKQQVATITPQGHIIHKKTPEVPSPVAKLASVESERIQNLVFKKEEYTRIKAAAAGRKDELMQQLKEFQDKHFTITGDMELLNVSSLGKGRVDHVSLHNAAQESRRITPDEFEKYLNDVEKDLDKYLSKKQKLMVSKEAQLSKLNNEVNQLADKPAEVFEVDAGQLMYVKPELQKEADLTKKIFDGYRGLRQEEASLVKETDELIVPKLTHPLIAQMRTRLKAYREKESIHCPHINNAIDIENQLIKWCEKRIKSANKQIEELNPKFNLEEQL